MPEQIEWLCDNCNLEIHPNVPCEEVGGIDKRGKPNALQTLWGSGDVAKDRKRRNTAKSMISPPEKATGGTRPQEIFTPQSVIDAVLQVWPEGIALDPCASVEDNPVPAAHCYTNQGLTDPWMDRTYCNPPYKDLKAWLATAKKEAGQGKEVIMLCPVRTHRKWFREAVFSASFPPEVSWLDPLKFRGYDAAFPAPLCLLYWGSRHQAFHRASKKVSK